MDLQERIYRQSELYLIRQHFADRAIDFRTGLRSELDRFSDYSFSGKSIAISAGSRGISNMAGILRQVVDFVRERGGNPFIFPAMGSHGGATAKGQVRLLSGMGITEESMACTIRSSMEVTQIPGAMIRVPGSNREVPVFFDKYAWQADGIILINRVKPHTNYHGMYESGLVKMAVIGAGNQVQATTIHEKGSYGLKTIMPLMADCIFRTGKIIGGIAIVEDAYDHTMQVRALKAREIMEQEPVLLELSRRNMPSLPVRELDILIVDRLGKNISGVGMDPNIIGRIRIRGEPEPGDILIQMIMVDDLTEESHGNALGIGLADAVTRKLFDKIDLGTMYRNVWTSTNYERARIPIIAMHAEDAYRFSLRGCQGIVKGKERVARIRDTLHLDRLFVSEAVLDEVLDRVEVLAGPVRQFTPQGELTGWEPDNTVT